MELGSEYQIEPEEVPQQKEVKKKSTIKKIIIGIIVVIIALGIGGFLLFRNLIAERESINVETFVAVMEENGYTTIDATYQVEYDFVRLIVLALEENHQFEFWEFDYSENARFAFLDIRNGLEATIVGSYSSSFINGRNFDTYRLTTDGRYHQILRVENIMIYSWGPSNYRNDIRALFRILENR